MTMPDAIAMLRAPALPEAVAPSAGAVAGGASAGSDGFAEALAGVMGDAEAAPVAEAGAAPVAATEAAPDVMLEDLGKVAALLPGVGAGAAAVVEGVVAALPSAPTDVPVDAAATTPAAALQAALAQMGPKLTVAGPGQDDVALPEGEGAEASPEDGEGAAAEAALAATGLPVGPAAQPATALPPGEGEAALGQAVTAALTGGAIQPMMQAQGRPAAPMPPALAGAATGEEGADAGGDGADVGAQSVAVTEAVQRREAAGLTPTLVQAVERAAARSGGEPTPTPAVEALTGATGANTAPAPLTQAAAQPAAVGGMAGFVAAGPILTDRPGWEAALADRISAELSGDGQQIDLELAPDHLGWLKIRLEMTDGLAQVRFVTETPEAARLIQANEHRLSDALSRAGLALGGQETASRDPQGDQRPARGEGPAARFLERAADATAATATRPAPRGLVNLIA